jgi:hypothetical protein
MPAITTPWAIIIAGAITGAPIAAAIALTNHWSLLQDRENLLRLNRWTGTVVICGGIQPGWKISCPMPFEVPNQEAAGQGR